MPEIPGEKDRAALFTKLGEKTVFKGVVIRVGVATYAGPDGDTFERDIVHHAGAVVVVPLDGDGNVILVRQYRTAIGREILEVPAGKRDVDGEAPDRTAHRELAEEVGRQAARLDPLAEFYNSPGFADEYTYMYLARDLTEVPLDRQGHEEQVMEVVTVPLGEALGLIDQGEIIDAKTIIGLTLTERLLARGL